MRCGMESISLWHCSGVMRAQFALIVAFSSSALLGLAYRIFLFTIPHRFAMGLMSGEFAGQLRTGIPWSLNQILVVLALCAGAKSCWKICISKVNAAVYQEVLEHFGLRKHSGPTPADDVTPQTITLTGLYTGLQTTWIVCLSSLPPDSGTLISKGNAKCTFIREHNFGPLSSSPVLSL